MRNYDNIKNITAAVNIINAKNIPTVTVNEKTLYFNAAYWPSNFLSPMNLNEIHGYYFSNKFLIPFQTAQLYASFTSLDGKDGSAAAQIIVPGTFEIAEHSHETDPFGNVIVPFSPDEVISLSWLPSEGAEYIVNISGNCWTGMKILEENNLTFGATEPFIESTLSEIFSESTFEKIKTLYDVGGRIEFDLYALSGPFHSGDPGNITGDAEGMFYGLTYGPKFSFRLELPGASKHVHTTPVQKEIVHYDHMNELIDRWLKQSESSFFEFIQNN